MASLHWFNLAIHIGAGAFGILLGGLILLKAKGDALHRRRGRVFLACVAVVCASAVAGNIWFRFLPLFALLTVLVLYELVSGWRAVLTRERGPAPLDALWTGAGIGATALLLPSLLGQASADGAALVVHSTLGALGAILVYDAVRWCFPRHWFAQIWVYEHIYKLIAALAALLSAFAGNTLRFAQPWSQILPSVLGCVLIALFFRRQHKGDAIQQ